MTTISFEKALADLEQTVAKLEKGGIPLTESLALFEKGVKLARFLRGELEKAERKVEILLKDGKGGVKAADFELEDEEGGEKKKAATKDKTGPPDEDEGEVGDGGGGDTADEDGPDKGGKLF
jgi:exodeoxyribonuclease VII small subunit